MITTKGNIVITFDDILVDSSYILYLYLCNNFSFYSKYFNLTKLYSKQDIYNRQNQNIFNFLLRDNIKLKDNKTQLTFLTTAMLNIINGFYNKDIYKNIELTKLGKTILLNPLYYENSGIETIYIIVKYNNANDKKYKELFLKKYIKNDKFKILFINMKESYYSIFTEIKKWNLLITDDISLIEKLAADNIDHKEFYLPQYGYNKASDNLKELIKQKYASIIFYDDNKGETK